MHAQTMHHENAGCQTGFRRERNEYIYQFVCAKKYHPKNHGANRDLLDVGILYVAPSSVIVITKDDGGVIGT